MIAAVFNTLIYNPLYNGLVLLINVLPWADVGIAIILFTIIVKLILYPLSRKSVRAQMIIRKLDPDLKKIREKYKNDKETQAKETMALYKEYNINPFSSILLVLIQLPIIFALYFVFLRGGLPEIHTDVLYSFISAPKMVSTQFLGIIDVAQRSIVLSLLAGITQFIQGSFVTPKRERKKQFGESLKEDMAHSMHLQMRYVMPVIIAFIAYGLSGMIALYWTTNNLFTIGQELFLRRRLENPQKGSDQE